MGGIKQLLIDENGNDINKFLERINKWKEENKEFFKDILSAKKYEEIKKICLDKNSFNKKDEKMIGYLRSIYGLCILITNSCFGMLISDLEERDNIYHDSFFGVDLVNWIYENFELETKESSLAFSKLLFELAIILPLNNKDINHIDSINSIFQFSLMKCKSIQRYLKIGKKDTSEYLNQDEIMINSASSFKKSLSMSKFKLTTMNLENHFEKDKQYVLEKPTEIEQTNEIEYEDNYIPHIQNNFQNISFSIYRAISNDEKLMFFLIEDVPESIYDETSKRIAMSVSEDPYHQNQIFYIPMLSDNKKFLLSKYHFKDVIKVRSEARDLFFDFENKMLANTRRYKFGVIYAKANQMLDENAIFSNSETTPEFEKFLNHLGDKITLKDWNKYAGGLNTKDNTTGEYSYYKQHKDFEIMYHVTTLLPDDKFDEQRIAKKKHTGNDLVVIIFCESKDITFSPKILTSQFNHVFILITIEKIENNKTYYGVNVATKNGVAAIPPFLPDPPIFKEGESFSQYIITKLINSERAAMYAPDFSKKTRRTRKALLEEIDKKIEELPKVKSDSKEDIYEQGKISSIYIPNDTKSENNKINIERATWIGQISQKSWKLMEVYSEKKVFDKNQVIISQNDTNNNQFFYKILKGGVSVIYEKTVAEKLGEGGIFINLSNSTDKYVYISSENQTEILMFDLFALYSFFEKSPHIGMELFEELSVVLATQIKNLNYSFFEKKSYTPINLVSSSSTPSNGSSSISEIEYRNLFHLPETEVLLESFPCLYKNVLNFSGTLYVSQNFVCFFGKMFQKETKVVVEISHVTSLKHNKNKLTIKTEPKKYKFLDLKANEHCSELILGFAKQKKNSAVLRRGVSTIKPLTSSFDLTIHCWKILYSCSSVRSYSDSQVILKQNTTDDNLYYIIKGNCKILKEEEGRDPVVLSTLSQGVFFGELSFLLGSLSTANVVSVGDTEIFSLEKEKLIVLFRRSSFLAARFFKNLVDILSERMASILNKNIHLLDQLN